MEHFFKIIESAAILPVMHAAALHKGLWAKDEITLRVADSALLAQDSPAMGPFPHAKKLAVDLMQIVGGAQLGNIKILRVGRGKKQPHEKANGAYGAWFQSYRLVLQGLPGCIFTCGDEAVPMNTGEVWWYDALAGYAVANNSQDDMVHMQIDIRIDK